MLTESGQWSNFMTLSTQTLLNEVLAERAVAISTSPVQQAMREQCR